MLLAGLLDALSPESAYARFLTGVTRPPPERLLTGLLPELPRGRALLAFAGGELVGHGLWARVDATTAEIALLVADRHQHRGVGTALGQALTDDLVAHGLSTVEVFASTDNRAVARMVARAAPDAVRRLDGPTSTYAFPARARAVAATA